MSGQSSMSRLEQRYRLLLRLLPAAYREMWQEEMVTTFLASMHTDDPEQADYLADYGRPSWPEVASVAALAVRLRVPGWRMRLGGTGAPPRNVVWGDAVRLAALIGLLGSATSVTGSLTNLLWLTGRAPWLPAPIPEADYVLHTPSFRAATIASLIWLPAYLALLFGQRRVCQLLAVLAIVTAGAALVLDHLQPLTISTIAYAMFDVALVLALLAFHRDAPPPRRRPWLLALAIGITVQAGLPLTQPTDPHTFPLLDWPAICCLALVIAATTHLAGWKRRTPSWSLALALLAAAILSLRTLTLTDYVHAAPDAQRSTLLTLGILETGAVLAVAVTLATLANRALRRLPARA